MSHVLRNVVVVCRSAVVWAVLLACAIHHPGVAMAQSQGLNAQRLIKLFDFEEADDGNYEDMPQHWYLIGRPANTADTNFMKLPLHEQLVNRGGYPHFTQVRFNRPQHEAGEHSFTMKLDGGNVGAFLEVGAIPAIPMSEYLVTVRVKTAGLTHASARLTAYLVDNQGRPIKGSQQSSAKVQSDPQSQDPWQTLSVPLRGEFDHAAWIGLELELLQPKFNPDSPLGNEQIIIDDIHGQVWWDDLAVWQLPQVSVQTQNQVNIVRDPHKPELTVHVRDVTGNALLTDVTVYNVAGEKVANIRRSSGDGNAEKWRWEPKLPGYGWYMADLTVYDTAAAGENLLPGAIAHTLTAFLWLPPEQPLFSLDAKRFMLRATDIAANQMKLVPELLKQSALSAVTLSLWDADTTRATMEQRQRDLDEAINPILAASGSVALSFSPAPREMLSQMDLHNSSVYELFGYPKEQWLAYLMPILLRHGQAVGQWQLGATHSPLDPADRELPAQLLAADRGLKTMAPGPTMLLPWSIHYPRRSDVTLPAVWMLDVPASVRAETIGKYLEPWQQSPPTQTWVTLHEPPASQMSREDRLTDLTLRMIHAWEANVAGISMDRPWAWATTREKALMPDSLLGVFSQVARQLAGRQAVGRLDLKPGLRCVIFDGPMGGMLAMWNESAEDNQLALYLGEEPVISDVWGNRTPMAKLNGVHRLRVGKTPVFIEGIDTRLAVMRAAFTLDEPFIESMQTPHKRVLTIVNPWSRTISGTMQIVGPEKWRIAPGQTHFSIAAGGQMKLPVQMIFPVSEVAGHKHLEVRMVFQADQSYDVHMFSPMDLGLKNITFDASLSYRRNEHTRKIDAVISQFVTNTGSEPVSLYAFAQTAGFPRQEGIISRLKPGESIIRRFRFQDVSSRGLLDQPLRVGLRETRGPAVLNEMIRLKPPVDLLEPQAPVAPQNPLDP